MPFTTRGSKADGPPSPRWKQTVSHKTNNETDTIGVCGEGSPFRLLILTTMEWSTTTCTKCKRLEGNN